MKRKPSQTELRGARVGGRRKTSDNLEAKGKALDNLAKKDLLAALRHANATPQQLITWLKTFSPNVTTEEKLQAIKLNPALALLFLETPEADDPLLVEIFRSECGMLNAKIVGRLASMNRPDFVYLNLQVVESVLPLIKNRNEPLPAEAIEEAYKWLSGNASEEEVLIAVRMCNAAMFRFQALEDQVGTFVANAASHAAASVKYETFRHTDAIAMSAKAYALTVGPEDSWMWYKARAEKLKFALSIADNLGQQVGNRVAKKKNVKVIQSIMVEKAYAPKVSKAKIWVKKMGGKISDVDETEHFWRFRQHDPSLFVKGSFRTHHTTHGIRTLVATPGPGFRALFQVGEEG